MMRAETRIDGRDLLGLGIVQFDLPSTLIDWKSFRRRVVGTLAAERHRLILSHASRDPDASLAVHRKAVGVRLALPDCFITPIWRRFRRRGIAFARRLRIANRQLHL